MTPDQILAEVRQLRDLMSWGVFPDGKMGMSSLLDPLLESSVLSQSESESVSQSVSRSVGQTFRREVLSLSYFATVSQFVLALSPRF